MRPVAFFDVDGTLFRSSLLVELVRQLIADGIFPETSYEQIEPHLQSWQAREGTYDAYLRSVIDTFIAHLRGVHYGELAEVGRRVVAKQSRHVYRYTRDLIGTLKKEGYYLVAISQSPKTVLDEFCGQYGFDKVYGRIYEIGPQDRFTGVVVDEHLIQNKATIVRRIFEKNAQLIRERSVAVGDTEGDIPLLESVAEPICFNPNRRLFDHAKRYGWQVVVERKDVIYHL